MKKLLYIFLLLISVKAIADDTNIGLDITVPSPNASSLGRYGDFPISYYTGKVDVNIPLYNTTQRGVSMDVSLCYDTSGHLVNSLPGWTGHNWTLNAGGVITRIRQKMYDEIDGSQFDTYLPIHNYLDNPGKISNLLHNNQDSLMIYVRNGNYDFCPDIFCFNFMGKTGRFFMGNDGQWKVMSDSNLKVELNYINNSNGSRDNYLVSPMFAYYPEKPKAQSKSIRGFTLIDENGTRYIFGCHGNNNVSSIEYNMPFFYATNRNTSASWMATAWHLTEVVDRYGITLYKLEYNRGLFLIQAHNYYEESFSATSSAYHYTTGNDFPYSFTLNSPVYLTKISMPIIGDSICFDRGPVIPCGTFYKSLYDKYGIDNLCTKLMSRSLGYNYSTNSNQFLLYYLQSNDTSVTQYQYNNTNKINNPINSAGLMILNDIRICSNTHLVRKYYFTYNTNPRLHLTRIDIFNDNRDGDEGCYKFVYNNFAALPKDYLTLAADHWGYYNGRTETVNVNSNPMIYRSVNAQHAQDGMLSEIHFPTGGMTKFDYHINTYDSVLSDDRSTMLRQSGNACGLRVEKISYFESADTTSKIGEKQIMYSNGQLSASPKYTWTWYPTFAYDISGQITTFRNQSIIPLYNSFGPSHGYSLVTVVNKNPDGVKSKYEYSFTNYSDYKDNIVKYIPNGADISDYITPYDKFTDMGFMRGKLNQLRIFDSTNKCVKKETYEYRNDNFLDKYVEASNFAHGMLNVPYSVLGTMNGIVFLDCVIGSIYKLYYPKYDVIRVTSEEYVDNTAMTTITYFEKSDYVINSGADVSNVRKCVSQFTTRGADNTMVRYGYEIGNTYFTPLISTTTIHNNQFVNRKKTVYGYFDRPTIRHGSPHYSPMYEIEYNMTEASPDTICRYMKYDDATFLLTDYIDKNDCLVHIDYTDKEKPATITTSGTKYNDDESEHKNIYSYNANGLLSDFTPPNGNTTHYLYDTYNRLKAVKDKNGKTTTKYSYHYRTNIRQ